MLPCQHSMHSPMLSCLHASRWGTCADLHSCCKLLQGGLLGACSCQCRTSKADQQIAHLYPLSVSAPVTTCTRCNFIMHCGTDLNPCSKGW